MRMTSKFLKLFGVKRLTLKGVDPAEEGGGATCPDFR